MDEILGFSLSQEELLAALLIADLPLPIGFDDLESRVFGDLAEEFKILMLAAAERSLIARGFLAADEQVVLEEYVKTPLHTCARPNHTWIILHQPSAQVERASYFHQADDLFLAHVEIAGIHQFLQLARVQDVIDTAVQLVSPVDNSKTDSMTGILAESIFAKLANSSSRPTSNELRSQLREAGLGAEVTQAFAETFDSLTSITAFARFGHVPQSEIQRAFTVVRGENGQWLLTLTAPDTLQVQGVSGKVLGRVLQDFGRNNY